MNNLKSLDSSQSKQVNWISGIVGTIIAYSISYISEDSDIKRLLITLTPAVTILLGGLIFRLGVAIYNTYIDWKMTREVNKTRTDVGKSLSDPRTSEEHKKKMVGYLEKAEDISINNRVKKIEGMHIITSEDELSTYETGDQ